MSVLAKKPLPEMRIKLAFPLTAILILPFAVAIETLLLPFEILELFPLLDTSAQLKLPLPSVLRKYPLLPP